MNHFQQKITTNIINYALNFISVVSVPLNIITYFAIEKSQCILIKVSPVFFAVIVLVVFLFKKQISTNFKSTVLIMLLFFVGIYTLLLGLLDMASLWFILSIIFAFFSKIKKLPITIFISAFFLTLITGLLMVFKNPYLPIDYGFENCQFACVSIRIINFLIIGFLIFKIFKIFFETVELYVSEITQKNIILEQLKITEKNEADEKLKNQILKIDNEKQQLELGYKHKELTNSFSKILNFNKLFNEIKKDISNQDYKNALVNLTANQTKNYSIETFLIKFNDIYPNFLIKLQETYPQLTDTETKVSILIATGLKSAEIGNLLNVAETSIGKYRNRIRKKLSLDNNADIAQYLFEKLNYNQNSNLDSLSE